MTTETTPAGAPSAVSEPASPAPAQPTEEQKPPASSAAEPAEQAKTEPSQPAADNDEAGQGVTEDQPKKSRVQERIDRLTAQKREAEARAAAAEARLRALEQPLEVPSDLSFEEQDALRIRQVLRQERAQDFQMEAKQSAIAAAEARKAMFEAKVEAVLDRMPDLVQKFAAVPVSEFAADFIAESEKAAELAYFLGSNPHEAQRIASLPDTRQAVELARIEARLNAAPQVRKFSQAPNPPPTIGGGSSPGPKDPSDMSDEEYSAWYRERQKAKR